MKGSIRSMHAGVGALCFIWLVQAPAPAVAEEGQLQEIVVTAQKRSENLQNVPIAITALSGTELGKTGPATSQDLNQWVPGLNIQRSGQDEQLKIRGIGTENEGVGDESNVAVYVDGVYQPITKGDLFHFADVEQVEVLKGPQGTLYGRNATGGLINIVTRTPSLTETSGDFSMSYSRFNTQDYNAYLSGPLASTVAAGIAAYYTRSSGYLTDPNKPGDDVGANDSYGVRAKVLWQPGDMADVVLEAHTGRSADPTPFQPAIVDNSSVFSAIAGKAPYILSAAPYQTATTYIPLNISRDFDASVQGTVHLKGFDVISISAVRHTSDSVMPDPDISPFDLAALAFTDESHSASEDFRLQSNDPASKYRWTAGVFGYWAQDKWDNYTLTLDPLATGAPIPLTDYILFPKVDTQAYAAYGQGSYQFTDRLLATVGARYSTEHKTDEIRSADTGVIAAYPLVQGAANFNNFSPKVTLQYELGKNQMVYASWAKGFKSGILNPLQIQDTTPNGTPTPQDGAKVIQPERITAIELGLKTDISRQLRADISVYHYDYIDLQQQITTPSSAGNIIENVGEATIKGMDADLLATFANLLAAADQLKIRLGLSYLDAVYDSYPNASTYFYEGPGQGLTLGTLDADGKEMTRSPKWTEVLNVDYSNKTPFGTLDYTANAYHSSLFYYDAANTPRFAQPAFTKVNLSVGWQSLDSHETISLWGKNVTNAKTFQTTYTLAVAEGKLYYPPAEYGITVGYRF